MKKHFITGLVILLPLALTIMIVLFFFNFFTEPFAGLLRAIMDRYHLFPDGFLVFSSAQMRLYVSKLLILIFLFGFTILLGAVARWFFIRYLIRFGDYIFHKIPLIRTIYKTSQDVISTLFTNEAKAFKQVVLVPFPNRDTYSLGFITSNSIEIKTGLFDNFLVAVFVPTTPNPTSGFLMMFKPQDIMHLDMKVEEALKFIISCGVIQTEIKRIS